jgi:hypothetical protein
MELVLEEEDVERVTSFTQDDMRLFFGSFASEKPISFVNNKTQPSLNTSISVNEESTGEVGSNTELISLLEDIGFTANKIYNGYVDDPRNTDNAWCEAEIWNFHYDIDDFFDKRIKVNMHSKWREIAENIRTERLITNDTLKEICIMHNAFYN